MRKFIGQIIAWFLWDEEPRGHPLQAEDDPRGVVERWGDIDPRSSLLVGNGGRGLIDP